MGDIGENYDPPVRPAYAALGTRVPRVRDTRPLLTSTGETPREEALRRAIARDQAELARLETEREALAKRFGEEPPTGSVITFTKFYPGSVRPYSYAALRAGRPLMADGWWLTGREAKSPRTWAELCEFIGDAPFRVIDPNGNTVTMRTSAPEPNTATPIRLVHADELTETVSRWVDAFNGNVSDSPFIVGREANQGRWQVIDERLSGDFAGAVEIVKTFPANDKGEVRARQSVRDRNTAWRAERDAILSLETEPPVWSRVTSLDKAKLWARRQPDGWVRYNGYAVQAVRLTWRSVRDTLGAMRPGTPDSPELINESSE